MSRDNIVCNRSILKYFKVETIFTELQSLRAAGATLPGHDAPIPTMSLAEVTRAADLMCNSQQVRHVITFLPTSFILATRGLCVILDLSGFRSCGCRRRQEGVCAGC